RGPAANVLAGQALDPTTPAQNILFEIDSSELDNPHWVSTNNLYDVIAPKGMSDGYPWPARFHIPVKPLEGGWFIDAYEYTPEEIIFYDNHVEVARIRYDRIRGQQNVWLTALNGFGTIKDTSIFPGESDFDYFRFYAKDWPGANLVSNEGFEYNLDSIDPQEPIAWHEAGDVAASRVTEGGAFLAAAHLRHSADAPYQVVTSQTLHYILDGTYAASAMVRSSGGQRTATFSVASPKGRTESVTIPATSAWTRILIPAVNISGNEATIAIMSDAAAGQWLEVDDVQFLKPAAPDQLVVQSKPFEAVTDPIWRLCERPTPFRDGTFSFFGREVGYGEAISVAVSIKPDALRDQVVLERMPRAGDSGWGLRLTATGDVVFRIGSAANHTDVVAKNAAAPDRAVHVACVFDRGTARLFIDGREAAMREGIPQRTLDKTAAGSLGALHRTSTKLPYSGIVHDMRVHNRALSAAEVAALAGF
ncbi:MAG: LamG domain-containing protein, partial [Opitutaceae bacterium]|nr:LamG domain-containing protein [Opitutaceae bacterium]